ACIGALIGSSSTQTNFKPKGSATSQMELERRLFSQASSLKELLEFAAVEPDAAALRAGIQDNRAVDAAVHAQKVGTVTRTLSLSPFHLVLDAAPAQRSHVPRLFREKLRELVGVEPNPIARRATVNRDALHGICGETFRVTFGTLHVGQTRFLRLAKTLLDSFGRRNCAMIALSLNGGWLYKFLRTALALKGGLPMKTVRDILVVKGREVWSVEPEASVFEALTCMAEKGVGAL